MKTLEYSIAKRPKTEAIWAIFLLCGVNVLFCSTVLASQSNGRNWQAANLGVKNRESAATASTQRNAASCVCAKDFRLKLNGRSLKSDSQTGLDGVGLNDLTSPCPCLDIFKQVHRATHPLIGVPGKFANRNSGLSPPILSH